MIYSGLDDIGKAKSIAGKVIQEVCFESMFLWSHFVPASASGVVFLYLFHDNQFTIEEVPLFLD